MHAQLSGLKYYIVTSLWWYKFYMKIFISTIPMSLYNFELMVQQCHRFLAEEQAFVCGVHQQYLMQYTAKQWYELQTNRIWYSSQRVSYLQYEFSKYDFHTFCSIRSSYSGGEKTFVIPKLRVNFTPSYTALAHMLPDMQSGDHMPKFCEPYFVHTHKRNLYLHGKPQSVLLAF